MTQCHQNFIGLQIVVRPKKVLRQVVCTAEAIELFVLLENGTTHIELFGSLQLVHFQLRGWI